MGTEGKGGLFCGSESSRPSVKILLLNWQCWGTLKTDRVITPYMKNYTLCNTMGKIRQAVGIRGESLTTKLHHGIQKLK